MPYRHNVSNLFSLLRSPSFAIIRLALVDKTVDLWRTNGGDGDGAGNRTAHGAESREGESGPAMYADGGGLYLRVTPEGASNWVLRYMLDRRPRWMGLGPLALYGLQEARARALDARRKRHEGIDPIEARRAERARQRLDAAKADHVQQCAEAYIASHRAGWRNDKHKYQWPATLSTYAYPVIGALPVQAVDTGLVLKVLEPIWTAKPETASRVRAARGKHIGFRQGAWLPRRRKPGALARPSRQAVAGAFQGARSRAPRRTALCRATGLPGELARARGRLRLARLNF